MKITYVGYDIYRKLASGKWSLLKVARTSYSRPKDLEPEIEYETIAANVQPPVRTDRGLKIVPRFTRG